MKIFKIKNLSVDGPSRLSEDEERKSKGASKKAASRYDQCSLENEEILVEQHKEEQTVDNFAGQKPSTVRIEA